ncbi:MAG: hypothetical protein JSR72_23670 [Proteobacteria bacterium]|nr:hypothetical protein [Pseudomonadota bacterium]
MEMKSGTFVLHPTFGLGKILSTNSDQAHVYFKDPMAPNPDHRVKKFRLPNAFLSPAEATTDEELDHLPPWNDDCFVRLRTTHTWDKATQIFRSHFPRGLNDPRFLEQEQRYKRAAHRRFVETRPQLMSLIEQRDSAAIADWIDALYGDRRAIAGNGEERLNLLYARVEEPAFFDALRTGGDATVEFAHALIEWIDERSELHFIRYAAALSRLPQRKNGAAIDSWTTATWLPFIADSRNQFLVKPTIVQAFASLLPFDLQYRADLNYATYTRCVAMAQRIRRLLEDSELNLAHRSLDLVDVQAFMWVVERYADGD